VTDTAPASMLALETNRRAQCILSALGQHQNTGIAASHTAGHRIALTAPAGALKTLKLQLTAMPRVSRRLSGEPLGCVTREKRVAIGVCSIGTRHISGSRLQRNTLGSDAPHQLGAVYRDHTTIDISTHRCCDSQARSVCVRTAHPLADLREQVRLRQVRDVICDLRREQRRA
jgi:hypothetical protein